MSPRTIGSGWSSTLLLVTLLGACLGEDGRDEARQELPIESGREVVAAAVDAPPRAVFGVVCIDLTCSADAEGSSDDVFIASYSWSWGDGASTVGGSSASAPSHTYATYGARRITLTVFDSVGQLGSTSKLVTLVEGPSADFGFSCAGRTCSFDASLSTGPAPLTSFHWDWDDESSTDATVTSATHGYAFGSTFQVHLRVTDANGRSSGITRAVVVP